MTTSTPRRPVDAQSPGADPFAEPERRLDGPAKVTGAAAYLADRIPTDTLWMSLVRSPYPHARVVSVDTSAAAAMPGVRAVLTGADVPGVRFGRRLQDWPVLAADRVRFIGDRVAAVAADSPAEAAAAAAVVEVEYEELPAILAVADATSDGAPILHPDAAEYAFLAGQRAAVSHPNIQGTMVASKGDADIEAALARADRVFEDRFTTGRQHQGHIEPHGASAWVADDGRIHVLTTNKSPFSLRNQLATAFGLAPDQIVVESGVIGGDFGGKGLSLDDAVCVALAGRTGRQVSAVMTYADKLQAANPRHGAEIRLRTGVDRDGRIVAHAAQFRFDGGAYAAAKPIPDLTPPGALGCLAAYDVPNIRIESTTFYTNTVPAGHMRSPGEVQSSFAGESHIDAIAAALGIDPLEFRLRNAARPGTTDAVGRPIRDPRAAELLALIADDRRDRPARAPGDGASGSVRRGRGVALTARHMEGGRVTIRMRWTADGSIEIRTGLPDQGGGAHTMMVRVAAAVLDLPLDRFRVTFETTDLATFDIGIGASRTTYVGSQATAGAATALRDALVALARERTGKPVTAFVAGRFVDADGQTIATEADLPAWLAGGPIDAEGTYDSEGHHDEPQDFTFAAYDIEVEIDERTGVVRVVDAFLAGDVGTIINPVSFRGQMDGGFAFGIGAALLEELAFDDGRVTTVHLGDYKLPTILDVPILRTAFVHADGHGAFGAKMAGELSVSGVAPAIANAVAAAVGARVMHLPLSPERVLAAVAAGSGAGADAGAHPGEAAP